MGNVEILLLLKMLGKVVFFEEIQEDSKRLEYGGKVISTIIEHDGNHKICVEIAPDDCHIFDVKNLTNLRNFDVFNSILEA